MIMKSHEILYSAGNNDECHTPKYAVIPILGYIPENAIVWCPFDTQKSEFVEEISKTNKVVFSHKEEGKDFYRYEPENWDIIISNPPFTNKRKIFEKCLNFNKPFALLMSNTWLNNAAPKQLFMQKELQLLMFDQRIKFKCNGLVNNKITYSSSYYCWNFLPKQIVMEKISRTINNCHKKS